MFRWILLIIATVVVLRYVYLMMKRWTLIQKINKIAKKNNGSVQYCRNPFVSVFKHDGKTFSLVIKEYPGAVPENKQELYDAMREHGFEHLFTINPMTLSGTVKELKANNDDMLPDWLEGLVSIYEQTSISVRKSN